MLTLKRSPKLSHNEIMEHAEAIQIQKIKNERPYLNLNEQLRVRSIKFHELYMNALRECYEMVKSQNVSDEKKNESFKDLFVENIRLISDGIPQRTLCEFIVSTVNGIVRYRGSIVGMEVNSPIIQTDMNQTPPIWITNLNFVVQPPNEPRVRIPMEKLISIHAIPARGSSRKTKRSKRSKRTRRHK